MKIINNSTNMKFIMFLLFLTSCKNNNIRLIEEKIELIESKIGLQNSNLSIDNRLHIISDKVDSLNDFSLSVLVAKRRDTISTQEVFECIVVPIRSFEAENEFKCFLFLGDSVIESSKSDAKYYSISIDKHKLGLNQFEGLLPTANDTLPIFIEYFVYD